LSVGFTTGVAVLIATTQLPDVLGLDLASKDSHFLARVDACFQARHTFNPWAAGVAAGTIALALVWTRLVPRLSGSLVAIVAATVAAVLFELPVETIGSRFGAVSAGIPIPHLPHLSIDLIIAMSSPALAIAFLASLETLLSATVADGMTGRRHRPDMELVALGAANILTPLFGTFTCTNGFKAAGGNPREGDDAYRDRLRQRDARYRRGTPQAVTLGALSVSGVERVTFRDPQTDSSIAAGTFQLVVGDARGIGSQPLADRVSLALADWAAEGASWSVVAAQTLSVIALAAQPSPIPANTVALRFDVTRRRLTGTFDQAAAERDLRVSLRELGEGLAHNAPLHLAQLLSAVIATDPALFRNVAVKALDAGGAVLATVSADWPAAGSAFRWEIPAEVIRFQWSEE
jgi:hypothetical protein